MTGQKLSVLHLGLDRDGVLWRLAVDGTKESLGSDWTKYLRGREIGDYDYVLMAADPINAALITGVYQARLMSGRPKKVLIAPPSFRAEQAADDVYIPSLADPCQLSASLGGRRLLHEADFVTYSIVSLLREGDEAAKSNLRRIQELVRCHPAAAALAFTSTHDLLYGAKLIASVLDPRWFMDAAKPNSRKRLAQYMGLGRDGEASMRDRHIGSKPQTLRLRHLLWAWAGRSERRPDVAGPGDSFWALAEAWSHPDPAALPQDRLVRACRVFLSFVSQVWLDGLTPTRVYKARVPKDGKKGDFFPELQPSKIYSPQLFVPHLFFDSPDEIEHFGLLQKELRKRR